MNLCSREMPQKRPDLVYKGLKGNAKASATGAAMRWGTLMAQQKFDRKLTRAALGAAVAVIVMVVGIGLAYAEDDSDDLLPDQKFFRGIMRGLGLRNGAEEQIEYKERPPLVVPPTRDLPPPVSTEAIAVRNPAWPADADLQRKAAEKKARAERKPVDWVALDDRLSPKELEVGKTNNPPNEKPMPDASTAPEMSWKDLGYTGGLWNDIMSLGNTFKPDKDKPPEIKPFVREPSRAALTDPPSGYRTPSPDQPYGIHASKDDLKGKAQTQEERQTVGVER